MESGSGLLTFVSIPEFWVRLMAGGPASWASSPGFTEALPSVQSGCTRAVSQCPTPSCTPIIRPRAPRMGLNSQLFPWVKSSSHQSTLSLFEPHLSCVQSAPEERAFPLSQPPGFPVRGLQKQEGTLKPTLLLLPTGHQGKQKPPFAGYRDVRAEQREVKRICVVLVCTGRTVASSRGA